MIDMIRSPKGMLMLAGAFLVVALLTTGLVLAQQRGKISDTAKELAGL